MTKTSYSIKFLIKIDEHYIQIYDLSLTVLVDPVTKTTNQIKLR